MNKLLYSLLIMNTTDIILLLLPLVTGFTVGKIVGMNSDAGKDINARPPGYVFGIAWTILYLLIGLSWVISRRGENKFNNILYPILIVLLCLWIILYKKDKKAGLYTILFCLLTVFLLIIYNLGGDTGNKSENKVSILLSPLFIWLIFATMLNYTEVNQK